MAKTIEADSEGGDGELVPTRFQGLDVVELENVGFCEDETHSFVVQEDGEEECGEAGEGEGEGFVGVVG